MGAFRDKVSPVYERFGETIGEDLLERALQAVSSD